MMPSIKTVLSFLQMHGSSLPPSLPPPPPSRKNVDTWAQRCMWGWGRACVVVKSARNANMFQDFCPGLKVCMLTDWLIFSLVYWICQLTLPLQSLVISLFLFGVSFNGDDTSSSYASPYRSWLSATSLAASVKVNSVVRPALNPALSAHVSINMLEVKCSNQLHAIGQGKL